MPPSSPRIWIDGFPLSHPLGTGITTYTRNMVRALRREGARAGLLFGHVLPSRLKAAEREIRFFDAVRARAPTLPGRLVRMALQPNGPWAHEIPLGGVVDRRLSAAAVYEAFSTANVPEAEEVWNARDLFGRSWVHVGLTRGLMNVRVAGAPPAVMHWMQVQPLRLRGALNVYTVHDLIPLRMPWATMERKRIWLAAARAIARDADHIITVSEHAKRDIISLLGVKEEQVTNTYQPVAPREAMADGPVAEARLRGALRLEPRGYFLFLSTVDPRKNLSRLLDAYYASGSTTPLIIVGKRGTYADEELRHLTEAGGTRSADGRVRHMGYLPRLDVDVLLRHAKALLFPSLYEGFGLPVVEAMGVGTPVLTSSTTSLPEVAGDAALLVDPLDPRAMAEAIRALDGDDALRARLAAMGPAQAALFSPERHAARLREVHARIGVKLGGVG
ncbi:glycosyltransferase family 4 protein [Sabulicella glaciei]|uniref:Glycosyltransferase family 4 protein n=1 Tax=Sabulicella glaciei TaxID=2984948 RepID=A0ABT3P0L2_9PROT|nr:glycosyltransferase family 1 protein [Roseococcus sp. MDT2-1-1]MCW8087936.1 glycosyltransferase family 4 protein [Roseococcus sp. MDT2-1-1]